MRHILEQRILEGYFKSKLQRGIGGSEAAAKQTCEYNRDQERLDAELAEAVISASPLPPLLARSLWWWVRVNFKPMSQSHSYLKFQELEGFYGEERALT